MKKQTREDIIAGVLMGVVLVVMLYWAWQWGATGEFMFWR